MNPEYDHCLKNIGHWTGESKKDPILPDSADIKAINIYKIILPYL